ncbi:MAG: class I mannose-6-phosphate isomerase [Clostridiales bacterium]|nr:class I mannose-6-phosphate isomerase [Clostridiales bacterium]
MKKLIPITKNYIWGGHRLYDILRLNGSGNSAVAEKIAEAWICSFNADGENFTESGERIGFACPKPTWGKACEAFNEFPALIKLIDSDDNLSVQVHPTDEFAKRHEGMMGKSEMWYVVDCAEGAGIYLGFKRNTNRQECLRAVEDGSILDLLNYIPIKKGESYFVPAGTVHAIGAGCLLVEIQQNSNTTFRLFDYCRMDDQGNRRELHLEQALSVLDFSQYTPIRFDDCLARCEYFTVKKKDGAHTVFNDSSYTAVTVTDGFGMVSGRVAQCGDCFFVNAGERVDISGNITVLETTTDCIAAD